MKRTIVDSVQEDAEKFRNKTENFSKRS